MFIEFLITFISFASTIFLYKFLIEARASFLVPTISDVILASAAFTVFLFTKGINVNLLLTITISSILFSFISLSREIRVTLIKSIAYTVLTILLPLIDINYIDAVYSFVTGDPWPTFRVMVFSTLTSLSSLLVYTFRREITYTIMDEESVKVFGARPLFYKTLLVINAAFVSLLLTSLYGFLGAHAIAFAAALLEGKGVLLFSLLASLIALLPLPIPPAYASAIVLMMVAIVARAVPSFRG